MTVESIIAERQAELGHMKLIYKQDIIEVDIASLKHHPLNELLYGSHIDEEFIENIKEHGVQEPITICRSTEESIDGVVVKGRRRCLAAEACGFTRIQAREWFCEDEDEFRRQLILSNVRNEQPLEHKIRMFTELKEIETRSAATRVKAGKATGAKTGKATELAAKQAGLSRSTAMRGEKVLEAAKALSDAGHDDKAQELVETLNTSGATIAAKKADEVVAATPMLNLKPVKTPEVPENLRSMDRAVAALKSALNTAYAAYGAVVRGSDVVSDKFKKAYAANHKLILSSCRSVEGDLSSGLAAADVLIEKWAAAKKGILNELRKSDGGGNGTDHPASTGASGPSEQPASAEPERSASGDSDSGEDGYDEAGGESGWTDDQYRQDIAAATGSDPGEFESF